MHWPLYFRQRRSMPVPVFSPAVRLAFCLGFSCLFCFMSLLCIALPASATTSLLRGEVFYQARIMPPPNAVLVVTLEEVSGADMRSREMASIQMAVKSGPPYAWQLAYDPEAIDGFRHVLRARMLVDGKLFMSTDRVYPALSDDAARVPRLLLRPVQAARAPVPAPTPALAPAPAPALARAPEPPVMPDALLQGTYWKLTQLGDVALLPHVGEAPEAHMVLHAEGRVAGSDGCNRMMGSYTLEAAQLWFERLAGTRMACPAFSGADVAFRRALLNATAWRLTGTTLELMAGREPVARFEAVALH